MTFKNLDTDVITHLTGDLSLSLYDPYFDLTVAPYDGGPIYISDWDQFFESISDLYDYCADNETALSEVKAHPCLVRKVRTPGSDEILEWVEEHWSQEFDEYDGTGFSSETQRLASELFARLADDAPQVWEVQTKVRLVLAVDDLDPEYDPEEDRYDD
jgi:hypothetical protein